MLTENNQRIKIYNYLILIIFALLISTNNLFAQKNISNNTGLVGILYGHADFTKPEKLWYLNDLNSDKTNWEKKEHIFSAKWIGKIISPVNGVVAFSAEADNSIVLKINGKKIIDSKSGTLNLNGKYPMKKGRKYPIEIYYKQQSGKSVMRVYWQWEGSKKRIVHSSMLSFTSKDVAALNKEMTTIKNKIVEETQFDVASIIQIKKTNDVIKKRNELIKLLWGSAGFPYNVLPDKVVRNIKDKDFTALTNLKRIDELIINMDFGLNSIAYHFIPQKAIDQLAIYHQGHDGKFSLGLRTIQAFLTNGYDVIALSMPLKGMNSKPIVFFKRFGKIKITNHEQIRFLKPKQGHPVKYFLQPVAVVVNYSEKLKFKKIIMIGISGGGWTTTMYAAIDPRINWSFPVAGSLPEYLKARDIYNSSTLYGDYEQSVPKILRTANYLELYIMGSFGKGRRQLQILNEFDACCFSGTGFKSYKNIVKNIVKNLSEGSYDVFLDSTHRKHQISPKALEVIFKDLKKEN